MRTPFYRFPEDILKPANEREREAGNIEWAPFPNADDWDIEIAWTTSCVTRGWIEYGHSAELDRREEEDPVPLQASWFLPDTVGHVVNHRARLKGLRSDKDLFFRIMTEDRVGELSSSTVMNVSPPVGDGASGNGKIPIIVWERSGKDRTNVPVSLGLPLPQGELFDPGCVSVSDNNGVKTPLQTEAAVRWREDGSIKWLWLHFQTSLTGGGEAELQMEYGPEVEPAVVESSVKVTETDEAVTVDTGPSRLIIPHSEGLQGGFFHSDKKELLIGFPLSETVDVDGNRYSSSVDEVVIESSGPLHSIVRVRGSHRRSGRPAQLLRYEMRLHAYAGHTEFLIEHTLSVSGIGPDSVQPDAGTGETQVGYGCGRVWPDNPDPRVGDRKMLIRLREANLKFGCVTDSVTVLGPEGDIPLDKGQRIFQLDENNCELPNGEKIQRLTGEITADGLYIGLRDFWQSYPKSIEHGEEGITLGLFPSIEGAPYDGKPFEDETKLYYHLLGGMYSLYWGEEKTHQIIVDVSPSAQTKAQTDHPAFACASPEWLERSGAFLPMATKARDQFPIYDRVVSSALEDLLTTRDENREYGALNYGDWHGERGANWGNLEYDLHHALLRQFMRTGEPEFFEQGGLAAYHYRDVDVCHESPFPEQVGGIHEHKVGHTGGYYFMNSPASQGVAGKHDNKIVVGAAMDPGHLWVEGLLEHGLLAADRRTMEVARLVADWMAAAWTTGYRLDKYDRGWPLVGVSTAYRLTEDPFYLNALRIMAEKMLEVGGAEGLVRLPLSYRHCGCHDVQHVGYAPFIGGIHATAKIHAWTATGDGRLKDAACRAAESIVKETWHPEVCSFRNTTCPNSLVPRGQTGQLCDSLAFAATHANNKRLAAVCRNALSMDWSDVSGQGKTVATTTYKVPQTLDQLSRLPGPSFEEHQRELLGRWKRYLSQRWPTPIPDPNFRGDGWLAGEGLKLVGGTLEGKREGGSLLLSSQPSSILWVIPGEEHRLVARLKLSDWESPVTPKIEVLADGEVVATTPQAMNTPEEQRVECKFVAPDHFADWEVRLEAEDAPEALKIDLISCDLYTTAQISQHPGFYHDQYLIEDAERDSSKATWKVEIPQDGDYWFWIERSGPEERLWLDIPDWPKNDHDYAGMYFFSNRVEGFEEARRWNPWSIRVTLEKGEHTVSVRGDDGRSRLHRLYVTNAC